MHDMHPKFKNAREAAGWHPLGFRIPTATQTPTATGGVLDAVIAYMLDHPKYQASAIAILELGVADGKVIKHVRDDGSVCYTHGVMA